MEILALGLPSPYEAEQLARVFFPGARPRAGRRASKGALVYARAGRAHLAAGLRTATGACAILRAPLPEDGGPNAVKLALCRLLYDLLRRQTGFAPPWGLLTGVRPLNLLRKKRRALGDTGARRHFVELCDVSEEKYALVTSIEALQRPILAHNAPPGYSLYVSVPFCPTRCAYCSFVSQSTAREGHLAAPYLEKLELELAETARAAAESGLVLRSVYIGGGTPTALDEAQFARLLAAVARHFDTAKATEYTVEAGRPDCTTPQKLALMREFGVGRVSINPQTMQNAVLRNIGRAHTAGDILRCYADARAAGFDTVNMDLIAGLPGDDLPGFEDTLRQVLALAPENITLHNLTLKRASDLRQAQNAPASPSAMLAAAYPRLAAAGYRPYYLYRQKQGAAAPSSAPAAAENLENTGWAKPGAESVYNICIMEEAHTILACGAGAVTKLVAGGGAAINRRYNFKYPAEYIERHSEVLRRKKGVSAFYAGHLDSETIG